MFEQRPGPSTAVAECNAATTAGKTLLASDNSEMWIIDTGATAHITSSLDMSAKDFISILDSPKYVYLSNGESTIITHINSSALSARSVISNVLYIPQFKYKLLSMSQVTKELGCSITVFPYFHIFQKLYSGKVKKVGKMNEGCICC